MKRWKPDLASKRSVSPPPLSKKWNRSRQTSTRHREIRTERFSVLIDSLRQRLRPAQRPAAQAAGKLSARTGGSGTSGHYRRNSLARNRHNTVASRVSAAAAQRPAEALLLVPEGPPQRFAGAARCITSPMRKDRSALPANGGMTVCSNRRRDYYLVEDQDGHRFWLYRKGILPARDGHVAAGSCTGCLRRAST